MNWQPIETAPRDGSRVLLWARDTVSSDDEFRFRIGIFTGRYWMGINGEVEDELFPTHWALVEPPRETLRNFIHTGVRA